MPEFLEELHKFRQLLVEMGMGQSMLALAEPKTLVLPQASSEPDPQTLFATLIVEPEISSVARDLFASGHFTLAIQEAFKALEKYIQRKTNKKTSGTAIMEQVFSPNSPVLTFSSGQSQSERDQQAGYMKMYAGAVQGVRNPCAHEFDWVQDPNEALELMSFAQHLLRKAKAATLAGQN